MAWLVSICHFNMLYACSLAAPAWPQAQTLVQCMMPVRKICIVLGTPAEAASAHWAMVLPWRQVPKQTKAHEMSLPCMIALMLRHAPCWAPCRRCV